MNTGTEFGALHTVTLEDVHWIRLTQVAEASCSRLWNIFSTERAQFHLVPDQHVMKGSLHRQAGMDMRRMIRANTTVSVHVWGCEYPREKLHTQPLYYPRMLWQNDGSVQRK